MNKECEHFSDCLIFLEKETCMVTEGETINTERHQNDMKTWQRGLNGREKKDELSSAACISSPRSAPSSSPPPPFCSHLFSPLPHTWSLLPSPALPFFASLSPFCVYLWASHKYKYRIFNKFFLIPLFFCDTLTAKRKTLFSSHQGHSCSVATLVMQVNSSYSGQPEAEPPFIQAVSLCEG